MSTVPIFAPDNTLRDVPQDQAQEALRQGGVLGISMVDPNGIERTVPIHEAGNARAQGGILTGSRATPSPQVNMTPAGGSNAQLPSALDRFGSAVAANIPSVGDVLKGLGSTVATGLKGVAYPQAAASDLVNQISQSPGQSASGKMLSYATGINPEAVSGDVSNRDYAGAAGDIISPLLQRYLAGKVASSAGVKAISPLGEESPVPGQNYTPSQATAFEGVTSSANSMGKRFIPQDITPQALSEIRNTAATMPDELATAKGGNPVSQLDAVHSIISKAGQNLEAQHTPLLAEHGGKAADITDLRQMLQDKISPQMAPSDISGINELIQRTNNVGTLNDLNRFRSLLNTEDSSAYKQTLTQQNRSGVYADTVHDLASNVRSAYYDQLQNASGVDMQPIKAKESNLIKTREAIENLQSPVAKDEAQFNAPNTVRGTLGSAGEAFSNPKRFLTQSILREGPNARLSMLIKKSLSDIKP